MTTKEKLISVITEHFSCFEVTKTEDDNLIYMQVFTKKLGFRIYEEEIHLFYYVMDANEVYYLFIENDDVLLEYDDCKGCHYFVVKNNIEEYIEKKSKIIYDFIYFILKYDAFLPIINTFKKNIKFISTIFKY